MSFTNCFFFETTGLQHNSQDINILIEFSNIFHRKSAKILGETFRRNWVQCCEKNKIGIINGICRIWHEE